MRTGKRRPNKFGCLLAHQNFIQVMVKYAKELETVESPLEPGVAAVLYLFGLR